MQPKCCSGKQGVRELTETADFLRIIAEPNRLKIVCLLREGAKCVCDIWQHLDLAQNLTSHHLKVLKDFGIVSSKQQGSKVIYAINRKVLRKFSNLLNLYLN